jgi:hypothetical protein
MFIRNTFYKTLFGIVLIGGSMAITLAVLLIMQAPRIRRVELDNKKLVTEPSGRIVLRANQPLQKISKSQVSLTPDVPFSVVTAGDAIVIQLEQQLLYDTAYDLRIQGIAGKNRRSRTSLTNHFRTTKAALYYLQHGSDKDQILTSQLGVTAETVVFEADQIKQFIFLDDKLIVATGGEESDALFAVDPKTRTRTAINLPGSGIVTQLRALPNRIDFGYLFMNKGDYENKLFIYDGRVKMPFVVHGLDDDKTFSMSDWHIAPDGIAALVQTDTFGTALVDITNRNHPVPLGDFDQLFDFSSDGSKFLVRDAGSLAIVDSQTQQKVPLADPTIDGNQAVTYYAAFLQDHQTILRQVAVSAGAAYRQYVLISSGNKETELYAASLGNDKVTSTYASPNTQYIATETAHTEKDSDTPITQTHIFESSNGHQLTIINGTNVLWD